MTTSNNNPESDTVPPPDRLPKIIVIAAILTAVTFVMLLGIQSLCAEDLGYHVLYGQRFWESGEIADHDDFLYTLPSVDMPPEQRPEPMAGAWYDDQGRLRFPNANWLTQVIFAGAYAIGGFVGLNLLLTVCIWALMGGLFLLMRRLRVGVLGAAAGIAIIALASYTRFTLRPELLGYIIVVGQLILLARMISDPTAHRLSRSAMVGLVVLQWAFVNVHSFFYFGWAVTAAVLADSGIRWLWGRWAKTEEPDTQRHLRANTLCLLVVLAAQVAICFVNPWTWRLVALPAQTAIYFREHNITTPKGEHPWSWLGEQGRTFPDLQQLTEAWRSFRAEGFQTHRAPWALVSIPLGLAILGAIAAILRRRWAQLLILAAGVYLALSMFRNMGVGTMLMVPMTLAGLAGLARWLGQRVGSDLRARGIILAGGVTALCCGWLVWLLVAGDFHQPRYQMKLGWGRSNVVFPQGMADWINEHDLQGRIWTDLETSSNLYFLLDQPRPMFPIINNGWAYPPAVMGEVFDSVFLPQEHLMDAVKRHNISAIVCRTDRRGKLITYMRGNLRWALVHLDGAHALFVRKDGPDGELALARALTPRSWDSQAFIERAEQRELYPAFAMYAAGASLINLRWNTDAVELLTEATRLAPSDPEILRYLGYASGNLAIQQKEQGDPAWRETVRQGIDALRRSLALRPDDETLMVLARMQQLAAPAPASPILPRP